MKSDTKLPWIINGYEIFAFCGPTALKIEPLAKKMGKSKSSFYHHFADMDIFIDNLLEFHISQSKIIAKKENDANRVDPDLIHVLVEHKIDLLFNRHLRINQNIKSFSDALQKSNKIVGDAFVNVWIRDLNLLLSKKQLEGIYSLARENFFLQINSETINQQWLSSYFKNLKDFANNFI